MSVAALDAVALRDCLRRGVTDLPRRYFRATAKAIGVAWRTGATSDLAFPEVQGRRTPLMRITNRLVELVLTASESDSRDRYPILQSHRASRSPHPPAPALVPLPGRHRQSAWDTTSIRRLHKLASLTVPAPRPVRGERCRHVIAAPEVMAVGSNGFGEYRFGAQRGAPDGGAPDPGGAVRRRR